MCGCLSHAPYWGPGPQPRHVPWLEIELVTLWFTGQHSIHWATPARATLETYIVLLTNVTPINKVKDTTEMKHLNIWQRPKGSHGGGWLRHSAEVTWRWGGKRTEWAGCRRFMITDIDESEVWFIITGEQRGCLGEHRQHWVKDVSRKLQYENKFPEAFVNGQSKWHT